MRHGIAGNTLNRKTSHRKATVRDIAKATLIQERICTTKAKAKESRKLVDQLITLGKKGTLADKRRAFSILCDHKLVSNLFKETSPRFKDRVGGYTRIIPLGTRRGDNAHLVFLELTEKKEIVVTKPKTTASVKKEKVAKVLSEEEIKEKKKVEAKETAKEQLKKTSPKDQGKPSKGFGAGIRKMFRRKSD